MKLVNRKVHNIMYKVEYSRLWVLLVVAIGVVILSQTLPVYLLGYSLGVPVIFDTSGWIFRVVGPLMFISSLIIIIYGVWGLILGGMILRLDNNILYYRKGLFFEKIDIQNIKGWEYLPNVNSNKHLLIIKSDTGSALVNVGNKFNQDEFKKALEEVIVK